MNARRILIYGVTGSGKSRIARRLSEKLKLKLVLVDDICFDADWVEALKEVQRERIAPVLAQDEWILDSAYGKWLDLVLPRAELIIGLDYPLWISLPRLWVRTARRVITQEPCCNGNRESLRKTLSRDSIIVWQFRSFRSKHDRILRFKAERPEGSVLIFTHPRQFEDWFRHLPNGE